MNRYETENTISRINGYYMLPRGPKPWTDDLRRKAFEKAKNELVGHLERDVECARELSFETFDHCNSTNYDSRCLPAFDFSDRLPVRALNQAAATVLSEVCGKITERQWAYDYNHCDVYRVDLSANPKTERVPVASFEDVFIGGTHRIVAMQFPGASGVEQTVLGMICQMLTTVANLGGTVPPRLPSEKGA